VCAISGSQGAPEHSADGGGAQRGGGSASVAGTAVVADPLLRFRGAATRLSEKGIRIFATSVKCLVVLGRGYA